MMLRVWVVLALIGGSAVDAEAKKTPWFNQKAEISTETFELPLDGIRKGAVKSAKVHKAGKKELIIFFPGVRSPKRIRTFTEGPIKSVKIRKVKRGAVVVLRSRAVLKNLRKRLTVVAGESPRLEFQGSELNSKAAAPIIKASKASKAMKSTKEMGIKGEAQKKVSKEPSPASDSKAEAAEPGKMTAFPWAKKTKKKQNKKAALGLPASAGKSSLAASGMLGLLLLGCVATVWALRRKKTLEKTVGGIQVVAVQPFGNKHKLALVQTCGEKLLIAASDKDVRLLSHVGNDLVSENGMSPGLPLGGSFKAAMAAGQASSDAVEAALPKEESTPSISQMEMPKGTVGGNLGFGNQPVSRDLDGLVALRKEQSQFANAEGLLGHFSKQYQRDGAAA